MLVIHPEDRTTRMLLELYEGQEVRLVDQSFTNSEIKSVLNHTPQRERIMLLGHGSDKGLFSRVDDSRNGFDRLLVYHPHAYYLRRHGGNLIAIWCNADRFARKEGLHGLFSGMIITELEEALACGVETTQEELERENRKLAVRLRSLLDRETPLHEIPSCLLGMDDVNSPLTCFNYRNFHYF